jgi:nitroreductase
MDAIHKRRSIRKFSDKPIAREVIEQIIQAGINAPSAKNRQPWRFVVVTADGEKTDMLNAMREGLQWMKKNAVASKEDRQFLMGAWNTLHVMEQAPVTIFVLNPEGKLPFVELQPFLERFMELANAQSVGACIENMCLAATDMGIGSLWICDVFQAYHALIKWLDSDKQLIAALSIGYAEESPPTRPRRPLGEITTWR